MIMIPVKIDESTRESMITNVVDTFNSATDAQRAAGEAWYPTAHALALAIAGNASTGAGVIAALSANKSWSENQRLARVACATGEPRGHVANALGKVRAILDGIPPEAVLPLDKKTGHFYACILDPSDPSPVCVDRHAHDVAVGEVYGDRERGLSAKGRYDTLVDVYRAAGARLGVLPQVVQAVAWVVHTQRIAGTSTRTTEHKGE